MAHYVTINGVDYEVTGGIVTIDNVDYPLERGLTTINGVDYPIEFRPGGTPLAEYAEGDVVYLNESGSPVEFYVAKHDYESGLNGAGRTLLVRKTVHSLQEWGKSSNAYAGNLMDSWLNNTWLNTLEQEVQIAARSTSFYYTPGNGNNNISTLTRAAFVLSVAEFGLSDSDVNAEGSALPIHSMLRPVKFGENNYAQQTRSPSIKDTIKAAYIASSGTYVGVASLSNRGARPCITLPAETTYLDENNLVIAAS